MRVVIALGGHALAPPGLRLDIDTQREGVATAVDAILPIVQAHEVVITHGNGPQVGLLAAQQAADSTMPPAPLDVLGAESDGLIGYLLETELRSRLPDREIATLLTQVEVDPADPAFEHPEKPIGPATEGRERRRVASPKPVRILELESIRRLVDANTVLVSAGGGGIPVARQDDGALRGVDAVVDKDFTSGLLAKQIDADVLLLLTDEAAVYADWPQKREPIGDITAARLRSMEFEAGSMGPKVAAACQFVEASGGFAAIGALKDAVEMAQGEAGSRIREAGESD